MNLQTEEIEFENQLVDISPAEIHLKKIQTRYIISQYIEWFGSGIPCLGKISKVKVVDHWFHFMSVDHWSILCRSQK